MRKLQNKADICIYTTKINYNISDIDFQNCLYLLSKEEQKRIIFKKNYKARCQCLISTLLIKKAIKDTLGLSESCISIKRTMTNRPYIEINKKNNIDFNVSHSDEWVVCAISSAGSIGIDIEKQLPMDINIGKEFLTKEEWRYLSTYQGEKIQLFYKLWTLKESFLKAVGIGINDLIREINFGRLDNKKNIFEMKINRRMWNFYHTVFNENYALSLTSSKLIGNIRFTNYKNLYSHNHR